MAPNRIKGFGASYFFICLFIIHSKLHHNFSTSIFYTIIVLKKNTFS